MDRLKVWVRQQGIGNDFTDCGIEVFDRLAAQFDHIRKARRQPSVFTVASCRGGAVLPPLDASEVLVHLPRRPCLVASGIANCLPIAVVRPDDDHGVVCGAAANRTSARIVNPVAACSLLYTILWILLLPRLVLVVTDVVIKTHLFVLSGTTVEHRHQIVPMLLFFLGLPAGLQQQHLTSPFCEARGKRATTRARTYDNVVKVCVAHVCLIATSQPVKRRPVRQKVFKNSIKARLSGSLTPGSSLKRLVPK